MKSYLDKFFAFSKRKNLVPKLASIILAVILWGYITNTRSGDLRFNIPVDYRNSDNSLVVSKVSHKNAVVRISGRKDDLKNVNARNIVIFVDLSKASVGEYSDYKVEHVRNEVPEGIDIKVFPEEVKVFVEKAVEKEVKVVPKFSGTPASGFHAGKVKVVPDTITLRGAQSLLGTTDILYTADISIDGKSEIINRDVAIERLNAEGVEYSRSSVNVTIPVISYSDITELEIPVILQKVKKGFKYRLETKSVKVHIIMSGIKKGVDYPLSAVIDVSLLEIDEDELDKKGRIEQEAPIILQGRIPDIEERTISITPDFAVVEVTRE